MSTGTLIVLAAHGGGDGSAANDAVNRLAAELASARRDVLIVAAFNLGEPAFSRVLDQHPCARAVVLPLMTSRGYFAGERLHRELSRNACAATAAIEMLTPLGVRDDARSMFVSAVAESVVRGGFDRRAVSVVVVGHGTRRNAESGETTEQAARELADRLPGVEVSSAFLDQAPLLEDFAPGVGRQVIFAAPFLLGGAGHERTDVPQRLGIDPVSAVIGVPSDRADGRRVVILPPLGGLPGLSNVIRAAIDEAVPPRVLRLGTRGSRLALWQAERASESIHACGADSNIIEISTLGDRDQSTPIERFDGDGPFSDDIENALNAGQIDIGVHSLKDLPLSGDRGLEVAGVLRRWSPLEALVTARRCTLADLPPGSVVGTCSRRRTAQLRRLRPDLEYRAIRGTVESRVKQVRDGRFAATVLALAGLARLGLEDEADEVFSPGVVMPEAGQGAIAMQVRSDDEPAQRIASAAGDRATLRAVAAERRFAELIERDSELIPAALATAHAGGLVLQARAISDDGRVCLDATVRGIDPLAVAAEAARAVLADFPRGGSCFDLSVLSVAHRPEVRA